MQITDEIIKSIAEAIDRAEVEYSMRLVRLVDGLHTYRLELDGIVDYFTDDDGEEAIDQCYARVREFKQSKQAKSVIAALEAALSAKTSADDERLAAAAAVNVIPLEWTDHPAGGRQAVGAGLGLYRVRRNGEDWYLGQDHMGKGGEGAANAHYERCILSAITTT